MRRIICAIAIAVLVFALAMARAQTPTTQIDPTVQIRWTRVTGSGPPVALCSSLNYGQPYLDITNNVFYTCGPSGWTAFLTVASGLPKANPVFTGTLSGPAAIITSMQFVNGNFTGTLTGPVVNFTSALQFNGTAPNGNYLRGNGTSYVNSSIQVADVPTLNQNTTGTAAGLSGTQSANSFYASPNGSSGTGSWRTIVPGDLTTAFASPPALGGTTPAAVTGTTITGATVNATTGYQLNGAATSANYLRGNGTNFVSSTIQASDVPTLNQNSTGTAANLSGTPALPNGTTATTQTASDTTTKLATDAYVNNVLAAPPAIGSGTPNAVTATTVSANNTINSVSGYLSNGTAASGNYLRANGTAFVSSTIQIADIPVLNQNTTGTAANLSGSPLLPNFTKATTQSVGDFTTNIASDAFVINELGSPPAIGATVPNTGQFTTSTAQAVGSLNTCYGQNYTAASAVTQYNLVTLGSTGVATAGTGGGPVRGIAQAGVAGNAAVDVCFNGISNVIMDGTAVAGNIAVPSTTTGGEAHDSGVNTSNSIQITSGDLGIITTGCTGSGCTAKVALKGADAFGRQVAVASGTAAMTTAAITAISGSTVTCGSTVTVSAPGAATTSKIVVSPNAAESSPNTALRLSYWPTAGNVNFAWCNPTASSQTPVAETLNWSVLP